MARQCIEDKLQAHKRGGHDGDRDPPLRVVLVTGKPYLTFTFTRGTLTEALRQIKTEVPLDGPARGLISAEWMADAIIKALEDVDA